MKTGRNLNEVLIDLKAKEDMKKDFIAPACYMKTAGNTFIMDNGIDTKSFTMTPLFSRQLASACDIPAKYYDRMREQIPGLADINVNTWLDGKENSYMVRAFDNGGQLTARAFLSDRYRRIDNLQVASAVLPLFAGEDKYDTVSCEVTDSRLYLKVVNKRLETEVVKGDIVQAGVMISNSEVGLGAVTVRPLIFRLVCENGMIADIGERKYHVGRASKADDNFLFLSDETIEAEDKAFMLKLRDVTMTAIDETRFLAVVDTLKESLGVPITGKVQKVVELTSKEYGFNSDEQDDILKYLIEGGDLTKYGLSNAVTRTSQDIESYDRATALEAAGWQVATMPQNKWQVINS